jgi:DNA-nicking Smr family endonuclease
MRRRNQRHLSQTEVALWAHVARSVRPFPGRAVETMAELVALDHVAPEAAPSAKPVKAPPKPLAKPKPAIAVTKPLAPLERRLLTQLKRGIQPIEAVIDLHGMRQSEAHAALGSFLQRAHWNGAKLVLVVTGKGAAATSAAGAYGDERGVLRRMVPHWLCLPDIRPLVSGFNEADQRHGGSGALYVRLRRQRDLGP